MTDFGRSLEIRLKKATDGRASLACIRPDGSTTCQRDRTGGFFPIHDLTHYAVETVLRLGRGFFGIVAEGWDLTDFGPPWQHGPLPTETLLAESIVGMLDLERATGHLTSADNLNDAVQQKLVQAGLDYRREVSPDELVRIRAIRSELSGRWQALLPGDTMILAFNLSDQPTAQ